MANVAVILAGGSGARLGLGYPKQFAKVAGKTIIEHTVDVFQGHPEIDQIVIVSKVEFTEEVLCLAKKNRWTKLDRVVEGGDDRFGSTWSALSALAALPPTTKLLFHDAVRPFIQASVIASCLDVLDRFQAVDVVIPTADTIVQVGEDGCLDHIPQRAKLRRGQTPQGFALGPLTDAYRKAIALGRRNFTCDCGVFCEMMPEHPIATVEGCPSNMKITHQEDLFLADKLFQSRGDPDALRETENLHARFRDATVVVFGGSYGIGQSIANGVRALGARAFPFSRSTTGTNVADRDAVRAALAAVHQETGRIDYVVNSAAVLVRKPLEITSAEEITNILDVNLKGAIFVALESHRYLKDSRGSLLFFTSSSYTRGRAYYSLYSATKSAVVNLTQALAEEWIEDGIRVNCINPERTKTPMRVHNFGLEPDDTLLSAEVVADSSMRALASPATGHILDVRRDARPPYPANGNGRRQAERPEAEAAGPHGAPRVHPIAEDGAFLESAPRHGRAS